MCFTPPLTSFTTITMALCLLSFGTVKARDLENIADPVWMCSEKCQRRTKDDFLENRRSNCSEIWVGGEQWVLPACVIKCLGLPWSKPIKSCCPRGKRNICEDVMMTNRTSIFQLQQNRKDYAWMRRLRIGRGRRVKRYAEPNDDELQAYFQDFIKPTTPLPGPPPTTSPPPPPSTQPPTLPPPTTTVPPPPPSTTTPPLPPTTSPAIKKEEPVTTTTIKPDKKKPERRYKGDSDSFGSKKKLENATKQVEGSSNPFGDESAKQRDEMIMSNSGKQATNQISTQGRGLQSVGSGVQSEDDSASVTTQSYAESEGKSDGDGMETTTKASNLMGDLGISKVQNGLKVAKPKKLGLA